MSEMQEINPEDMERLLQLSEDDLYIALATNVYSQQAGSRAAMLQPAQALLKGRELFERYKQQLYQKICVEWDYCAKRKQYVGADETTLFSTIAGLIAGFISGYWIIAIITALVLKYGLDKLCKCSK